MDAYKAYFHHTELGSATGIIFMIYTIGNMVGSLFTGPICDRFGRRAGMICGSVLIMVGAIVQTAARNDSYLLGGRFTLGFGVSIGTSSAPTYALELSPPQWRARVVGYYNTCKSNPLSLQPFPFLFDFSSVFIPVILKHSLLT